MKKGTILRGASIVFLAAGVALLGYCVFVRASAWWFEHKESPLVEHRAARPPAPASTATVPAPAAPATGDLVGRITIPRVGVSAIIAEGADGGTLRRAVGHISGTALPGQPGNVGLAGHRDTFFRPLRNIRSGDTIVVTTARGDFSYRVVSTSIVDPYAVEVLNPTKDEVLTLVTCYPFYYIGAAPNRFIVRAALIPPASSDRQTATP